MSDNQVNLPANFRFSQSSLQDYTDCPRRFQLRYIEKLTYPSVETEPSLENERHQQEGELFHRLVQQYLIGIPADRLANLANTPNLQVWWENFLEFSRTKLNNLDKHFPEITLSTRIGSYRLLAKYDLISITPHGKAVIYDWKTYRKRPANEWFAARLQTRVYRALLLDAGTRLNNGKPFEPECIEMIYWLANTPHDTISFVYTEAQSRRDRDALIKLVDEIADSKNFPKTEDDKNCRFCTYRSYCSRGNSAGNLDDRNGDAENNETLFNVNFEQISEIEF